MKAEVMRPANEAELSDLVRGAGGAFAVRGGGTRAIGPVRGAVLDTGGLSGVRLYEPGALTLVAAAGTPLAEVEALLAGERQRLAFEVPDLRGLLGRAGVSTLGGVVAANASGPRRVQAGACRDSLLGLRFVDGRGEVIKNGGRVMKNVTGYDLVKLLAGSRGALGVITEVSLKVQPMPETSATLRIMGLPPADAVAAMAAALGSPYDITGAAHGPGIGTLLRLEGFVASVSYRAAALAGVLARFGAVERVEGDELWRAVRDVQPLQAMSGDVWRLAVKPSDSAGLVARLPEGAGWLMDWGGGLIWARVPGGLDLRAHLAGFAGHATRVLAATPGDGIPALPPEAPAVAALTAALRRQFGPRGLFQSEA